MTTVRTILAAVAGVATFASLATADSIELRRSIRRETADRPIVLRDIADLVGPNAEALADIEIAAAADLPVDRPVAIEIGEVRARLDAAGIAWARVDLTGGTVRVRPAIAVVAAVAAPSVATAPRFRVVDGEPGRAEASTTTSPAVLAGDLISAPQDDLRAAIARIVLDDLATAEVETDPARVQLTIDGDDLAALPENAGDGVVRLRGRAVVDHVIAEVTCRQPDGRRRQHLVSVEVRLMRLVPVAARRIQRGRDLLGLDTDLALDIRPCLVSEPQLDPRSLVGRRLLTTIDEGERIVPSMLVPENVVRRGSTVVVRTISAGYELRREMEAAEDGAIGDTVVCHEAGRRGRGASITAIVVGPGLLEVR